MPMHPLLRCVALPVSLVVAFAACAAPNGASNGTQPPVGTASTEQPAVGLTDSVFASSDSVAWVLAREGLFEVTEKGLVRTAFEATNDWATAAISANGSQLTIALAIDGSMVQVVQSSDSGATWIQLPAVDMPTMNGISTLTVGANESTVVVLADESSSNVSFGTAAVTTDGGKSWRTERPPTGGRVFAAGNEFWLVGGVVGDETYVSADGSTWFLASPPQDGDWTANAPWALADGSAVLPVTSHGQDRSVVSLWALDGAKHWVRGPSVDAASTEIGVAVPAAGRTDGTWVAVLGDGSKVFGGVVTDTEATTISPNGLPAGILQVGRLGSAAVLAFGMTTSCPDGKTSCASAVGVWYSPDLGQTWVRLGLRE